MARSRAVRLLLLVLVPLAAYPAAKVAAQAEAIVNIVSLDSGEFPSLSLFVSVNDTAGNHVGGLPARAFSVIEDGATLPGLVIDELQTGTRLAFTIDTSSRLKRKNPSGETAFDSVRRALLDWWTLPGPSTLAVDDLTLITTEGALVTHSSSAARLASALDQAQPNLADTDLSLNLLSQSLAHLTDPEPRAGMTSHLIFITPGISSAAETAIVNAITRAQQERIAIHVVLVAPPALITKMEADTLQRLARETGGTFVFFDPATGLTSLAQLLTENRFSYRLTVNSQSYQSGDHTIQVVVSAEGLSGQSAPEMYDVDISSPEVAFVSPPLVINRYSEDPSQPLESLAPRSQTLQLLSSFPDGHPRGIVESWLFVDGEIVARRTDPPYDLLEWPLESYLATGDHTLQAGVQDDLGLRGASLEIRIQVTVPPPPQGLEALRPVLGWLAAAVGILIGGVILALSLLAVGRKRRAMMSPPVSPPLPAIRLLRAGLRRRREEQPAEAYLVSIAPDGQEGPRIPVTGAALSLGRSAALASVPIEDPSVSSLHARLIRLAGGRYVLRDQGSVAGTWVNYEPVPEEGQALQHGDLVHLGRVAFRFCFQQPPAQRQVRITPLSEPGEQSHPSSTAPKL